VRINDPVDAGLTVVIVAGCAFLVWALIGFGLHVATEDRCLAAGYRDAVVTATYQRYCVTRTEQTDIVKPLSEVSK
jgi:hypothetical protein